MLQRNKKLVMLALVLSGALTLWGPLERAHAKNQVNKTVHQKKNKAADLVQDLSGDDKVFVELREASKANDVAKVSALAPKLSNYELQDYVTYYQLRAQIYDKGNQVRPETTIDSSVEGFLTNYDGTAIADRLRNDWLLVLGKRKEWAKFDQQYSLFVLDDDTQVKCYLLQSRLAKSEDPKRIAKEAKNVMLDPQYWGEGCPELIQMLYQQNGLSRYETAAFGRIALENGFDTLAKRAGGDDPIADIVKKAKIDPTQAYKDFEKRAWRTGRENSAAAWGVIGQFLAKKMDKDAIKAYRLQHAIGFQELLSAESQEWKVRVALKEGDWVLVKESIENMTPALRRKDPAWAYWYARAQKQLGDDALAKENFQALAEQFNFYGQLAREELGVPIYVPKRTHVDESLVKQASQKKGFARAERFYAMGLRFEGNREWNWELRNLTDRQLIASAEHAKRIGLYDRAVNTADRTKTEHDFTLRYPTPYKDSLLPIAQQVGLDVNWAYGLIRQESRFIMNAKSNVGASGLMQVMPSTAKYVAKKIGMNGFTVNQLGDTHVNLTLGSNYLNMVLQDLEGSWAMASAAYNAGPSRPKQWREKLQRPVEGAIFAETIPFNETRTYVKNVLSNANYYAAIANNKPGSLKDKLGTVIPKTAVMSELP